MCHGKCGGTVFKLTPPAAPGDSWTENVLYEFIASSAGVGTSGVVLGAAGELYGLTGCAFR